MKIANLQIVFFLAFLLTFVSVGFCAEGVADVNEIFKVGEQREIEVAVPKKDFIGAPPTAAAYPEGHKGLPTWDKDFRKRYVRITVLEKRKLKEGTRVILRLDGIDADGNVLKLRGRTRRGEPEVLQPVHLYYACLDVKPSSCKTIGFTGPRYEESESGFLRNRSGEEVEDIGNGVLNRGHCYSLPFPLMLTCPPALSPDKSLREGCWMNGDDGVVYTGSTKVVDGRRVRVALLRKVYPSMKVNLKDSRYYSDKDKTLSKEAKADSIKVIISAQEIQMWKTSTDWLWETMERTDGKGHITMRCRRLK